MPSGPVVLEVQAGESDPEKDKASDSSGLSTVFWPTLWWPARPQRGTQPVRGELTPSPTQGSKGVTGQRQKASYTWRGYRHTGAEGSSPRVVILKDLTKQPIRPSRRPLQIDYILQARKLRSSSQETNFHLPRQWPSDYTTGPSMLYFHQHRSQSSVMVTGTGSGARAPGFGSEPRNFQTAA